MPARVYPVRSTAPNRSRRSVAIDRVCFLPKCSRAALLYLLFPFAVLYVCVYTRTVHAAAGE